MKQFNVAYDIFNNKRKNISIIKSAHTLVIRMHPDTDFSKMMLNTIDGNVIKYKVIFRVISANTYVVSIDAPPDRVSDLKKVIASNETVRFAGYGFKTEKNKEAVGKFWKASAYHRYGKSLALSEQGDLDLYLCQGKTSAKRDLCPGNPLGNTCGDLSFTSAGSG